MPSGPQDYADPFTDRPARGTPRQGNAQLPVPNNPYSQGSIGSVGSSGPNPFASASTLGQPEADFLRHDPHGGYGEEEDELKPLTTGQFTGGFYPPPA